MAGHETDKLHLDRQAAYSVLMSVYHAENPEFLRMAIDSIYRQTVYPGEFVLVCDGPLPEPLERVIHSFENSHGEFRVLRLPENRGLWSALDEGIRICSHEIIIRMDSDDIALPERCEKQLRYLEDHPEVDVCSGQIAEFAETPRKITGYRILPCTDQALQAFAKKRNPINHMAAAFRKAAVLAAGGYRNVPYAEDYDLWVRMILNGSRLGNLPDVLVYARIGNGMIARRGGRQYARSARMLQKSFYKAGFLSRGEYLRNCAVRTAVSLLPERARQLFYRKTLREQEGRLIETV